MARVLEASLSLWVICFCSSFVPAETRYKLLCIFTLFLIRCFCEAESSIHSADKKLLKKRSIGLLGIPKVTIKCDCRPPHYGKTNSIHCMRVFHPMSNRFLSTSHFYSTSKIGIIIREDYIYPHYGDIFIYIFSLS